MDCRHLVPLASVVATGLLSCDATLTEEELEQGIMGVVTKSVGDFQCCGETGETFPISVPVHIVLGPVEHVSSNPPPELHLLPLELTVKSDSDGRFHAPLPPGTYTLFAEIDGALYLNCHELLPEGEKFCSVTVDELEFQEFNIQDTSEATF